MKAAVAVLFTLLAMSEARVGPQGVVYQFPISSILQCRRVDNNGDLVPVPVPQLPLEPAPENTVWLPPRIPFAAPPGTIDANMLLSQLPGFDGDLQSVLPPTGPCGDPRITLIPASGFVPPRPRIDNLQLRAAQMEASELGFSTIELSTINSWWNAVGFPSCDVPTYEWTRLPDYYFPQYFCGGRCSGANCSAPLGQTCRPTFRNQGFYPALRWDCCWDTDGSEWQWACGWREVQVPFISECRCSCRNVF